MDLKNTWAWIRSFPSRINGFSTPFFGLSWTKDDIDRRVVGEPSVGSAEPKSGSLVIDCVFCSGCAKDPYRLAPCRVCRGAGTMDLEYDDPVSCRYCDGSGQDPYSAAPCVKCGGLGVKSLSSRAI